MDASVIVFFALAVLTVASAVIVVFHSNIIYSAFALLFTLSGVAGFFVLLHADFIAAVQVLLYVGGILVLIIFGVLLTRKIWSVEAGSPKGNRWVGMILGLFLTYVMCHMIDHTQWTSASSMALESTTELLGRELMTRYVLPFELASLLLLVALIGAVFQARYDGKKDNK